MVPGLGLVTPSVRPPLTTIAFAASKHYSFFISYHHCLFISHLALPPLGHLHRTLISFFYPYYHTNTRSICAFFASSIVVSRIIIRLLRQILPLVHQDGEAYAHLLNVLAPEHCSPGTLDTNDPTERENLVLEHAGKMDCKRYLAPKDIVEGSANLNLAFVAHTVQDSLGRFALDIDLDAPKIRIPIRLNASSKYNSHFRLDFGHFTLRKEVYFN
ncbi:unnamed protein product [Lactuca virosa]|uniref:Calponin-homology (CH) domain-containing protein n=1 Tax=Lactuca virosa TaxID=75947 RepID=A0AAU9N7P6_9ASTR|nr:unnamed protein product [Lactuca virosa]